MTTAVRQLAGREDELAKLVELLDAPTDALAAVVVVGEAGIGKTTLWLAAREAAEARGALVLSSRPSEAEARFSFVGVADLIGGVVDEVLPELPRPQRRALEGALALSEAGGAIVDEGVVAFAFLSALRQLADTHRLVLAIDDVQWLDQPSVAMLRFALPRIETGSVTVIMTARGDAPDWLPRALPDGRLQIVELASLSVGALHALLRARLDSFLPRPALLRIWEASGGNPFFALELANAFERRGGMVDAGAELPMPANLDVLMQERLDRLDSAGLEVARVVAALASPTVGILEPAAGRQAESGLASALAARILELDGERVRFSHPLLRSAMSTRSTPAKQRSLHARLAAVVPGTEERARHLALATAGPDRDVAAVVEEAAGSVHARGAAAAAVELAELAVRLTPAEDVDDLRRRVLDCADRHREAGDGHRAIAELKQACAVAPRGAARATVLVRLAQTVREVVGPREAISLARAALTEAAGDDALEATTHLSLAGALADAEDNHHALEHAELAVAAASRAGDAALRCDALAAYGFLHFREGLGIPVGPMDEALSLEQSLSLWPRPAPATAAVAMQLVWSCDLVRARPVLDHWRRALSAQDDPDEDIASWLQAMLEWRAGNWQVGARHATDSLAIRAQFGREGSQPIFELPAAMIAAHEGRIDEARERSERALSVAESDGVRIAQSGHRCVLGFIELSLGNAETALEFLEPAWQIRDRVRLLEPGWRLELADTLEALIEVGRLDAAEEKLVPWEERSRALDRAWALAITGRARGLLLAARGDFVGARTCFERALDDHARAQDPFQHARTLLAFGVTQRRGKQRGDARLTLEHALEIFERVGAPLWSEKARAELRRIGGRAPSRGDLTEAERRIAELVAEGRTNRDVAATLFVTEHTVEAALTRAYRKLGVRSRGELAHRLKSKL